MLTELRNSCHFHYIYFTFDWFDCLTYFLFPFQLQKGHGTMKADKRERRLSSNQRMSPYFFLPTSSHSSQGTSHSPPLTPYQLCNTQPNYYYPPPEYVTPMWHINRRYKEDELPNATSNMAAALYQPRLQMNQNPQVQIPTRRFSIASNSSNSNHMPPSQRRRISVTKFQNIPPANFLQVPSFNDFEHPANYNSHHIEAPIYHYDDYSREQLATKTHYKASGPPTNLRKKSDSADVSKISRSRRSQSLSRESFRSHSPVVIIDSSHPSKNPHRSPSLEIISIPDPKDLPIPAFEFTSSHLPLRPPSVDNRK